MFNLLKLKTMKKNFLFIAFAVVLCWATSCQYFGKFLPKN